MNRKHVILGVALTLSTGPATGIAGDLIPGARSDVAPSGLEIVSRGLILPETGFATNLSPLGTAVPADSNDAGEYTLKLSSGLITLERSLIDGKLRMNPEDS